MVLEFAPQGALDRVLASYKRAGVRLNAYVIQKCIVQVWIVMLKDLVLFNGLNQSQNTHTAFEMLATEEIFRVALNVNDRECSRL